MQARLTLKFPDHPLVLEQAAAGADRGEAFE